MGRRFARLCCRVEVRSGGCPRDHGGHVSRESRRRSRSGTCTLMLMRRSRSCPFWTSWPFLCWRPISCQSRPFLRIGIRECAPMRSKLVPSIPCPSPEQAPPRTFRRRTWAWSSRRRGIQHLGFLRCDRRLRLGGLPGIPSRCPRSKSSRQTSGRQIDGRSGGDFGEAWQPRAIVEDSRTHL